MNILYRLTQNTFRECVREPVFYLLQLVGLVLIGILPMFSMFVFREQIKLVVDSSMATTMVLGLIAAALCFNGGPERTYLPLMAATALGAAYGCTLLQRRFPRFRKAI